MRRHPDTERRPSYPRRCCDVEGCDRLIVPRRTDKGHWETFQNFKRRRSCSEEHRLVLRGEALAKARAARGEKAKGPVQRVSGDKACRCGRPGSEKQCCRFCATVRGPSRDDRRASLERKIAEVESELRVFSANGYGDDICTTYALERLGRLQEELEAL